MNFEEFKNLIKERKRLQRDIMCLDRRYMSSETYLEKMSIFEVELKKVEEQLQKTTIEYGGDVAGDIDLRLGKIMRVSAEKLGRAFCEFAKNKHKKKGYEDFAHCLERKPQKATYLISKKELKWYLYVGYNDYMLEMSDSGEVDLKVLYINLLQKENASICEMQMEKLIQDHPKFEEVMWDVFEEEIKSKNKSQQKTLIQKMAENTKETESLEDQQSTENQVEELTQESEEFNQKYEGRETTEKEIKGRFMKFTEFKEMCLEHKRIQKEQGSKQGREFLNEHGKSFSEVAEKFKVEYYYLESAIKEFFDKENLEVSVTKYDNWDGREKINIKVKGFEEYELNTYLYSIDTEITLEELFCYDDGSLKNMSSKSGIGNLLVDFPNLEEYLWECVKKYNNRHKELKINQNETVISKYSEELDLLVTPAKREERISLILRTVERIQQENKEIADTLDEI